LNFGFQPIGRMIRIVPPGATLFAGGKVLKAP
jgi:hypothetical protein